MFVSEDPSSKVAGLMAALWAHQVVSVSPARIWLDVDSPLFGAQVKGFQGAVFAEELDTVSVGVAAIVPCSWLALRVFVCEAGAQCLNHRL